MTSSVDMVTAGEPGVQRPYFVLSYAHSAPLAGVPEANPDELVGEFFGDLAKEVRRLGSLPPGITPGFYDQAIPLDSDWKQSFSRALGAAQVFVPLYSAAYVGKSRPGQECACFQRRVELAGIDNPWQRLVPVLWTPLSEDQHPAGLAEAMALGSGERDYTENGLWALLKIGRPFRDSYRAVVNVAAKRIVALAEGSPIMPSEVPDIDRMKSPFTTRQHLSVFAIETAAPTVRTVASERGPRGYGENSSDWRPFSQQEQSLAEYAEQIARRLDFKPEVIGIRKVNDPRDRRPGIILIDPWFIADDVGRMALASAVQNLPRWVLPMVIIDDPGDASTQKLADQALEILNDAGALPTDSSRRAARGVSSLDEFVSTVRVLVAEAERQYLRYRVRHYQGGQASRPSGPVLSRPSVTRPRLLGPAAPDEDASAPDKPASPRDPLGDTPDA
jgi:FxsC-like protein